VLAFCLHCRSFGALGVRLAEEGEMSCFLPFFRPRASSRDCELPADDLDAIVAELAAGTAGLRLMMILFTCTARAVRGTGTGTSGSKAGSGACVGGTSIFASCAATPGVTYSASEPESRRKMFSHLLLFFFLSRGAEGTRTGAGTGGAGSAVLEIARARICNAVAS
jgi:hypothetical protein